MSMNIDQCRIRYENDAEFHTMVGMFYNLMFENKLSLVELKDALCFAGIKFQMENAMPMYRNVPKCNKEGGEK